MINFPNIRHGENSKETYGGVDLFEIYERVVNYFTDEILRAISSGNLQVIGETQIMDLRTLIEMSERTHPPILHKLNSTEINTLNEYINNLEAGRGFTGNSSILAEALRKLVNTLAERLRGRKTRY
jgi:bisphosphoglycerate-dependent phosphoglycerate mutase